MTNRFDEFINSQGFAELLDSPDLDIDPKVRRLAIDTFHSITEETETDPLDDQIAIMASAMQCNYIPFTLRRFVNDRIAESLVNEMEAREDDFEFSLDDDGIIDVLNIDSEFVISNRELMTLLYKAFIVAYFVKSGVVRGL